LNAIVLPDDADDKSVTWESSKPDIATVADGGIVKAEAEGECEITVRTKDGDKTATCRVKVNLKMQDSVDSITIIKGCYYNEQTWVGPFKVDSSEFADLNFYKSFDHTASGLTSDVYLQFSIKNTSSVAIPAGTPYKFVITRNDKPVTEVRQKDGTFKPIITEGKLEKDIAAGEIHILHKEDPFFVNGKVDKMGQNECRIEIIKLGKKEYSPTKTMGIPYKIDKK
jgi:hypothetical protein